MRCLLITTLFVFVSVVASPHAVAQPNNQVRYESLEDAPYAVNGRIMLHPAYAYIGTADTIGFFTGAEVEFTRRLAVGGSFAMPYHNLTGDDRARDYRQAEVWVRFNVRDALVRSHARMTLASSYTSNTDANSDVAGWTNETYVNAPTTAREFSGLRVGVQYLQLPLRRSHGEFEAERLGAYVGYHSGYQTNRAILFHGFGERTSRVRFAWFADVMAAPLLRYDALAPASAEPDLLPGGFGGRIGMETSSGVPGAMAGRFEMGFNPGAGGLYLLATVGFDINLRVGGGHALPRTNASRPPSKP